MKALVSTEAEENFYHDFKPRNVKTKGNIHRCSAGNCGGGEGGDTGQVETVLTHVNTSEMSQRQTWLAMIEYKMTDGRK